MKQRPPLVVRLVSAALISAAGCASGPPVRPHVTALVFANTPQRSEIERALTATGAEAEIELGVLPSGVPEALDRARADALEDRLAAARSAYEAGDYERCSEVLSAARVEDALAVFDRFGAARLLWWQAACARASSGPEASSAWLEAMLVLGLARPGAEVEAVAASLDVQLADLRASIVRHRGTLEIDTDLDARIAVDGATLECAEACRTELLAGRHWVHLEADGRVSRSLWVEVPPEGASVAIELQPGTPELAAQHWRQRYSSRADRESTPSLALLRRALRAEQVVLVLAEGDSAETVLLLRGVHANADGIAGRAERTGVRTPVAGPVQSMLFELLPWARPEEWWESPWTWIAVGLVLSATAVGVTYYYVAPLEGPSFIRVVAP